MSHSEENPIEPLHTWFRTLLIRPSGNFVHLQHNIEDLDNWGLAREITCFHKLN